MESGFVYLIVITEGQFKTILSLTWLFLLVGEENQFLCASRITSQNLLTDSWTLLVSSRLNSSPWMGWTDPYWHLEVVPSPSYPPNGAQALAGRTLAPTGQRCANGAAVWRPLKPYGPLQVTSTDLASAAKPWASKCQICPVPVFWRLGELGDAWATVTLKTVFCFEAQILLSPAYMKPMVFNQGKVLLCVGASSFCSADLLSIFFSFIHGNLIDVSCRRRWEAIE